MNNVTYFEEDKKQKTKSSLTSLIKEVGFTEIISSLGELAKEKEDTIEKRNNSVLSSCFESTFLMLIGLYPKMQKKDQKLLRRVLIGDYFNEGLKIIKWDSPMQSSAMKDAYVLVNSWKEVDKSEN